MAELARQTMRMERRALVGWSLATAALVGAVLAFWPSIGGSSGVAKTFEGLPPSVQAAAGLEDIGTAAGYLQGQLFSTLAPLIFLAFAIGRGARAIAGEEEAGTMDLLLATPVRRSRIVFEKAGAIAVELLALAIVLLAALAVIDPLVDIHIAFSKLIAATIGSISLGALYGAIALAIGAATAHRAISTGVAAALAGAGYLYTAIAPSVSGLSKLLWLSPMDHAYGYNPLENGLSAGDLALLFGATAALLALAAFAFDRRDVQAG